MKGYFVPVVEPFSNKLIDKCTVYGPKDGEYLISIIDLEKMLGVVPFYFEKNMKTFGRFIETRTEGGWTCYYARTSRLLQLLDVAKPNWTIDEHLAAEKCFSEFYDPYYALVRREFDQLKSELRAEFERRCKVYFENHQ